jgi:hypothetical protein
MDHHFIDPKGPIDQLRVELISLCKELARTSSEEDRLFFQNDCIPLLQTNDEYVRFQARTIIKSARASGIKIEISKH